MTKSGRIRSKIELATYLKVVKLQIAFVSRVCNFSTRIVVRSFHNACNGWRTTPWYKVYDCTMQPSRRRTFSYRETDGEWPMGVRSFFVMIVILEPDQPRASRPALLHRFLAVISCPSSIYTLPTTTHFVLSEVLSTCGTFLFANLLWTARQTTLNSMRKPWTRNDQPIIFRPPRQTLLIYNDWEKNYAPRLIVFPESCLVSFLRM